MLGPFGGGLDQANYHRISSFRAGGWLLSIDNPLTARVAVNRIWANHFGYGIVRSVDNFGKMADPPTHAELLDWLTVEIPKPRLGREADIPAHHDFGSLPDGVVLRQ